MEVAAFLYDPLRQRGSPFQIITTEGAPGFEGPEGVQAEQSFKAYITLHRARCAVQNSLDASDRQGNVLLTTSRGDFVLTDADGSCSLML